jgi:riboflavin kinase/FMN adenylyltransferase
MDFCQDISQLKVTRPVVTIGMFDGVHRGHRSLLGRVIDRAKITGGESVVLTFWPHPRILFEGEHSSLRFLTTIEEKISLLKSVGVDHVLVCPFTREFAQIEPADFVKQFLVDGVKARHVIVGYDHRFGFRGKGDYQLLEKLGTRYQFGTEQVLALDVNGTHVSSTKIREALMAGEVEKAAEFLSYEYSIAGTVVRGNQIGRTIGFPTANIEPGVKHKQIPGNGIYIVEIEVNGQLYGAVANVGNRPTVVDQQQEPNIEAYILRFNDDIYGKPICIRFKKKIRDEKKFASLEELSAKIRDDVSIATTFFNTSRM